MSRPIVTIYLSPRRWSPLPEIDASVSTRVVSWNDAAEMNESVDSDALVIPSSSGRPCAGRPSALITRSFSSRKRNLSTCSSTRNSVSPTSSIFTHRIICLARLARLEQLDHARQTARDVLGLGRLARDLGENLARRDHLAVLHHEVRVRRHLVAAVDLPVLALDLDRRLLLPVRRVDDDQTR